MQLQLVSLFLFIPYRAFLPQVDCQVHWYPVASYPGLTEGPGCEASMLSHQHIQKMKKFRIKLDDVIFFTEDCLKRWCTPSSDLVQWPESRYMFIQYCSYTLGAWPRGVNLEILCYKLFMLTINFVAAIIFYNDNILQTGSERKCFSWWSLTWIRRNSTSSRPCSWWADGRERWWGYTCTQPSSPRMSLLSNVAFSIKWNWEKLAMAKHVAYFCMYLCGKIHPCALLLA